MHYIRPHQQRGHANFGWLSSHHSFSFGQYYDPSHMGISNLRVINDDQVAGGAGFDPHGHRDMEIISYILEGTIEHKDSMGNHFLIPAGDVQIMSAGSGIMHSEYNHHSDQALKFLQIWILPEEQGITPRYEQKTIAQDGVLTPLVTPNGEQGSLSINADASLYRLQLAAGEATTLHFPKRSGYLHVIEGDVEVTSEHGQNTLTSGDGAGTLNAERIALKATASGVQALWFDLAPAERL
ncbi:pirin family protein [Bacterioplanes sanyensis]|uniref:Pirin family protein n=1 Tax=Bacterioplanes sanyensis TaxID=1249553 RepID=A0A222FMY3_9GAMM|nr:pirin family protein [Bacterioplanes sanyensis]ASP40140.1 pirin family protein [Bacterioplanes sanyensis]